MKLNPENSKKCSDMSEDGRNFRGLPFGKVSENLGLRQTCFKILRIYVSVSCF
jgi:hypothetical protein